MKPTTIVLIGAGGIARAHLGAAEGLGQRVKVTAVIEPNPANLEAAVKRTGARGFASSEAFFAADPKSIAQAALICTPPNARLALVQSTLSAGLSVLVEKPLAHRFDDAKKLIELSKKSPELLAAVGYCHRFTPAMIEMKRRADAGELGEVLRFENTFACWFPSMEQHWMSDPAVSGGGSFLDTGCHSLDLFRYLVGQAPIVSAVMGELWKGRGESHGTVTVRSTSTARHTRCVGVIQSGWAEAARFTVGLVGTKASLFYDYEKPTELVVVPSEGARSVVAVETHDVRFQRQLESFAAAVAGDRPALLPASFDDGLQVARLVDETGRLRQVI